MVILKPLASEIKKMYIWTPSTLYSVGQCRVFLLNILFKSGLGQKEYFQPGLPTHSPTLSHRTGYEKSRVKEGYNMNIEYSSTYSIHRGGYMDMEVFSFSRPGVPGNLLGSETQGNPLAF